MHQASFSPSDLDYFDRSDALDRAIARLNDLLASQSSRSVFRVARSPSVCGPSDKTGSVLAVTAPTLPRPGDCTNVMLTPSLSKPLHQCIAASQGLTCGSCRSSNISDCWIGSVV